MNRLEKAAAFGAMMGKKAALDPAVANALGLGAVGLVGVVWLEVFQDTQTQETF